MKTAIVKPFIFDVTCPHCEHEAINPRENSLAWEEGDIEAGKELFCAGCGETFALPEQHDDDSELLDWLESQVQVCLGGCGWYRALGDVHLHRVSLREALRQARAIAEGEG